MPKGSTGTQTNIIIKVPTREKLKYNCKLCLNLWKNVCYLGRTLNASTCKWHAKNYYLLSKAEAATARKQNKNRKVKR